MRAMNYTSLSNLRAKYRAFWDAYQVIAHQNAQLLKAGKQPPDDQVLEERKAAAAVEKARDELLTAITRLGN